VADHLQKGKTSKESKELVTLEHSGKPPEKAETQGILALKLANVDDSRGKTAPVDGRL
jgi:hypothetical protein